MPYIGSHGEELSRLERCAMSMAAARTKRDGESGQLAPHEVRQTLRHLPALVGFRRLHHPAHERLRPRWADEHTAAALQSCALALYRVDYGGHFVERGVA